MSGVQPFQNFQTGLAGHIDVQDRKIRLVLNKQLQCAGTIVAGGNDVNAELLPIDDLLQAMHDNGFIVSEDQIPHDWFPP